MLFGPACALRALMHTTIASVFRFVLIGAGAVASIATSSVEPGDRYNEECPIDEECSDQTPQGLFFGGMPTGDGDPFGSHWAHATAVGGTQTVRVFLDSEATMPLNLPFDAALSDGALSITSVGTSHVTLHADSIGSPKLRILVAGTGLLLDRITVESLPLETMQLVPAGKYTFQNVDLRDGRTPFAILVGKTSRITTQLFDSSDVRVVDEGMLFDWSESVAGDPLGFADTVAVTPSGVGAALVVARSAGSVNTLSVMAVDRADEIVETQYRSIDINAGVERTFCFRARSDDAVLINVDWSYRATGPQTMSQAEDELGAGCIALTGTESGLGILTVSGAGISTDFQLVVRDGAAAKVPLAIEPVDAALAGDRAEALGRE